MKRDKVCELSASELAAKELNGYERAIWENFINDDGEIEFNSTCVSCEGECKQSYKFEIMYCPKIDKKR